MSDMPGKESWHFSTDECPTALAFDTAGERLAIADASGRIVAINVADGELLGEWYGDSLGASCLAWNPSRPLIAAGGSDGTLRLFAANEQSATSVGRAWLEQIAWSPDGERCAVAAGREVVCVDVRGQAAARSKPLESTITGLSWRSRGRQLVTSCYGGVQVFDSATLGVTRRFRWKGSILTLALSSDERIVATGCQDDTVHFWRFADGGDAQMSGYPAKPTSLSWSADSRNLATNGGSTIVVWSFDRRGPEGRPPRQLTAHRATVSRVAFASLGMRLASGCCNGELFLWDVGGADHPIASARMDTGVELIAWGGRDTPSLAVADTAGTIQLWSIDPGSA